MDKPTCQQTQLVKATPEEAVLERLNAMRTKRQAEHDKEALIWERDRHAILFYSSFEHVLRAMMPSHSPREILRSMSDEELAALEKVLTARARQTRIKSYCFGVPILVCIPVIGWMMLGSMLCTNSDEWPTMKFERRRKKLQMLFGENYFKDAIIPYIRKKLEEK